MGMVSGAATAACSGGGGVGQNQVHAVRDKAVDDGGAVWRNRRRRSAPQIGRCRRELLGQRILKALRGSVQRDVLHELADADLVGRRVSSGGIGSGGGFRQKKRCCPRPM